MKRSMQRVISSALALSMMASVVPTSALALAPAADPAGIAAQVEDSKELSGDGALTIVNGRPNLSQALKQEGTVYYGNGWNYDQSTDTLSLIKKVENSDHTSEDVILGSQESPMRCKVVIGTKESSPFGVNSGYFANDVTLVNGGIYRGVFYDGSHFTTEDQDEQAVGYCVFANPPVGVAYSTVTTKDPALAAKMETCMSPNYAANFRLSGGTVYVTAGQYHWFGIFGIDENDVTDINGQKLELTEDEESGSLRGELKDTSGETTIAGIIVGSAEMVKESFPDAPEKPVLLIHPLDGDSHVYELNQNYKPEEEDKGALTLVNGRPDLSQALKQEGTVYYGTNWNYDTNSETLTLTGNQSDAAGNWILGTLADPVRCDVVVGTAETKVVVEGGCFRGTVRVVNGKVGGVFQGRFINEMKDAQPDDMGYMVFTNEPEGVSYSTVRTRDGSFASKMQVGLDPDYMWTDDSGKDPHVYVTAGKNHYFMLMGVSKGELLDVSGCVLNLHENTEEDACDADSEFLAAGALVDVLKDASGNKFAKVYYLPADVASAFDDRVSEEVFLFVPLDDTSREYNLNELSSSMMGLSIKNGKPDLSYALRQDGSMYYGKSWSYDASSDTLTFLQGKDDMDEGRVSDVGTATDPVTSKVVIEKYNYVFNCHFAGEVINRGRMDVCTITGPLTNDGGEVDYCGFTTPPSGMNYQTLRMDDELVSKAEIIFDPEWLEESVITGNPLYFVAGETGPIYLWKLDPSDIKDINGQTLTFEESPEEEEEGLFRAALMDESGSKQIAWIYYAPEGTMEAGFDRSDPVIGICSLDEDSHVYEVHASTDDSTDEGALTIVNGRPDLSQALKQEGTVYYGNGWNYDQSTDTLSLIKKVENSDHTSEDVILGSQESPMRCKVVIGTKESSPFGVNSGYFANDVTLVNGGIYRGVFYDGSHFTTEDQDEQAVGYCVFANPPVGVAYSTVTTKDPALAAKMETCMSPNYAANFRLSGGTVYVTAGQYHWFGIFGIDENDVTDINGQKLELTEDQESGMLRGQLYGPDGETTIAELGFGPSELIKDIVSDAPDVPDAPVLFIFPLDDDSRVYELNQNYKPEEEDKTITELDPDAIKDGKVKGLEKTDDGLKLKEGYKMELPDDTVVSDNIENKGTIVSGTFEGTVTGGEIAGGSVQKANGVDNISGGNVQEAKDVKEISGGNVEILENADKISGGNVQEAKDVREISGGNIGAVEKVEKISGGNVQEAKDVKEISGGTVAYVEEVENITGGVIGGQSVLSDEIKEKADVLNLVNADGTPLLDGAVNDVIVPQGAAAVALFSMENGVDEEPLTPVAYIFDSTRVTVRYTGNDAAFKGWTSDDVKLEGTGSTVSFSMENVTGKTITLKAVYSTPSVEPSEPEQPGTPNQPEEKKPEYTITVEDGQINGKASAVVKEGDTVSLTVGEVPESMAFLYWDIPTELMQALTEQDVNFNNKAENLTFKMPKLAESAEKSFTIRAAFGTAETADDGDYSALGVVTGVVAGGAAATVVGWQLYNIGTDLYLQAVLPKGAAIPTNRQELALLLWQNAGKPEAVTASYADIANDQTDAQKAARWAVANGLLDAAGEDATVFAPAKSVSRLTVIKAWNKAQKLKKQ